MITEFAAAKVNLSLRVTGKRPDGYHLLNSLVAFADVGDVLTFEAADEFTLAISGPFAAGLPADSGNLVIKAAFNLAAAFPGKIVAARIRLQKNLPVASGIGGGSADAAAALRGLCRLSGLAPALLAIALPLGADVPVCLQSRASRMGGIGEEIAVIKGFAPLPAVLVNPAVDVSTRDVFARLVVSPSSGDDWTNDLEAPALALQPVIGQAISALRAEPGVRHAGMSGSGATCFGTFATAASAAEAALRISKAHAGWWCKNVVLR